MVAGVVMATVLGLPGVPVHAAVKPEIFVQTGHGFGIHAVAYSADGKLIATAAADKTIKLWDAASGRELKTRSEERRVGKECRSRWSPYH